MARECAVSTQVIKGAIYFRVPAYDGATGYFMFSAFDASKADPDYVRVIDHEITFTLPADWSYVAALEAEKAETARAYQEVRSNASLIDAAPRMFQVIEAGARAGDFECIAILEQVNGAGAAIAKAEGCTL